MAIPSLTARARRAIGITKAPHSILMAIGLRLRCEGDAGCIDGRLTIYVWSQRLTDDLHGLAGWLHGLMGDLQSLAEGLQGLAGDLQSLAEGLQRLAEGVQDLTEAVHGLSAGRGCLRIAALV